MKRLSFNISRSSSMDLIFGLLAIALVVAIVIGVSRSGNSPSGGIAETVPSDPPAFGGPGAGGIGGRGGPGGLNREPIKLLNQFDENGNGWLNAEERQAALAYLETQDGAGNGGGRGGGFRGGPRFGRGGAPQEELQPGPRISPADVASHPGAPLYDPFTLRTLFLEFENDDWEKELESFRFTDVDVPASLQVDGRNLREVGVRFRGNTSYSTVGSGRKRPLNLRLDLVHPNQEIGGYTTLNLLNAHGDPSFLRSVLYYEIARQYIPAFKANFVRLVINGESWGIYSNVQQFDSKFSRDFFGTPKGARWKVPGSPRGQGGLAYLGDEIDPYRQIFELQSREDPKSWVGLILLSQTLNDTPTELLESALDQVLDVDGVLRFLALDNVFANNDGFWVRASDYSLYQDVYGRFHVMPYDANETFAIGGGGGGGRGPGGPGGRGRFGPGAFSPGAIFAPALFAKADENDDGIIGRAEVETLADAWYQDAGVDKSDALARDQFVASLRQWVDGQSEPNGQQPQGRGGRGRRSPVDFLGNAIFMAIDVDGDDYTTHTELQNRLGNWFTEWDTETRNELTEEQLNLGINETMARLRQQNPGGAAQATPGRGRGGAGGPGGFGGRGGLGGGPGGRPGGGGVELDPLVLENDSSKPLASKLLAVPELRSLYLSYVRDIAENWLDWEKVEPLIRRYEALIEEDVKTDTRKLFSTEEFYAGIDGGQGAEGNSLKSFIERRQAFLLKHDEVSSAAPR